jgi:hypothetical protein
MIFYFLISIKVFGQTANAGSDVNVYLNLSSSARLDGSGSSASNYKWSEISTDYSSGVAIINSTSKVATVSGLPQGVFYFQLAATTGSVTKYDTTVVRVFLTDAPANSTLLHSFNLSDPNAIATINQRDDTTSYFPISDAVHSQFTDATSTDWFLFRDRLNGLYIDTLRGKLVSMIEDGYEGTDGYPRAEIQPADYDMTFDTSHIYMIEWQGYLPQNADYLTGFNSMLNMVQLHSKTQTATVFQMNQLAGDYEGVVDVYYQGGTDDPYGYGAGFTKNTVQVSTVSDFYNKAHTVQIIFKEGKMYTGQDAFIELKIDGVTKYYRNKGQVGSANFDDYPKFAGLYDANSAVVNKHSLRRERKYKLVTTAYNIYTVTDTTNISISVSDNNK